SQRKRTRKRIMKTYQNSKRTPLGTVAIPALAIGVLALAASVQPARANEMDLDQRIRKLERELETVKADKQADASTVTVQQKGGRMLLSSADGNFTARVGGRILMDTAWYDEDVSDMGSGTRFRQARLEAAGTLYKD